MSANFNRLFSESFATDVLLYSIFYYEQHI